MEPTTVLNALRRALADMPGAGGHLGSLVPVSDGFRVIKQERLLSKSSGVYHRIEFEGRFAPLSEFDVEEEAGAEAPWENPPPPLVRGWIELFENGGIPSDSDGILRLRPWKVREKKARSKSDASARAPRPTGAGETQDSPPGDTLSSEEIDRLLDSL